MCKRSAALCANMPPNSLKKEWKLEYFVNKDNAREKFADEQN